jgi:AcrR family transcriptional regulator
LRTPTERAEVVRALAEVFREHGYDGASLALIAEATGLGKGSLYHFFPGGKAEMATAVLGEIDRWFEAEVFAPLDDGDAARGVATMLAQVERYFRSGRRVCLVGALALTSSRDRFAAQLNAYFRRWLDALAGALRRLGATAAAADQIAEDTILTIQGALVLARAIDDPAVFERTCARLAERLHACAAPGRARPSRPGG